MFTSALRADQYLDVQIKCVVGALNLLESQLATALVAVRRGWWLNKGTHDRLTYLLTYPQLRNRTRPGRWCPLFKTPKAKEILEFFGIQNLGKGDLDRSVAINGPPDRACQGLVSDPASVSVSGAVGSLLSPCDHGSNPQYETTRKRQSWFQAHLTSNSLF